MITLTINNHEITVENGTTVAAAVLACGTDVFRRSVSGTPRGPLCGMGICFECRVTIDGVRSQKSCNVLATEGMEVVTDG
ncbi:MAG: (2Fe-2S)-binding protein [Pyrinomonadaceae bacterium]|nr:(2Fe-2S)-binding protein [Pyrinomonadaceae bacterium]MBP6211751.1 (2Fe-2S)-binding protein [Pyrinomonadaceae bacterium]